MSRSRDRRRRAERRARNIPARWIERHLDFPLADWQERMVEAHFADYRELDDR